ncbi:MAG: DUF6178 family protein [Acidobacteriota bacterium]
MLGLPMPPSNREQDFAGVSFFLTEALQVRSKSQLEEFLSKPNAARLLASTPYQDIFLTIKTVGLADCLDLLPMATRTQRRGFVDLDCWRKDAFHRKTFTEWLAAFIQTGPEETVRMARAVDPELLALFLKHDIRIHPIDPEEPSPDLALTLTPDGRFGIEVISEEESTTTSRLLLDALFRFDPALAYDVIDRVYWDNSVSLEETAYQNKRRRLEEIGFVDYFEALEIYSPTDTVAPPTVRRNTTEKEAESLRPSTTLPALLTASLVPGQYLFDALQSIQDPDRADNLREEMSALANRLLSVHAVTPGDLEKVRPALEEMRDTLNLGLEFLAQSQRHLAVGALQQYRVATLFKTGFELLAELRHKADQILRQGTLRLGESNILLLETPEAEFFAGLRRLRPLFFEGVVESDKSNYRSFQSLDDVHQSELALGRIESLGRSFWRLFGASQSGPLVQGFSPTNVPPEELRFGPIFLTALFHFLHDSHFVFAPLAIEDLQAVLRDSGAWGQDDHALEVWILGKCEDCIADLVNDEQVRSALRPWLQRWSRIAAEELDPLSRERSLEARLLKSVCLFVR